MILVAGGTGFLGSAIVRALMARGQVVAVLSHRPQEATANSSTPGVEIRAGDARIPASLTAAVDGIETVISCMQFPNFPIEDAAHGETFEEVDARGNERLVAAARNAGARNYIYISGAGAAPDGRYHWLRAKWRAEEAVRSSGLRFTILRPSWVYGPADRSLNRFVEFARRLPFIPVIGDGRQRLQPAFVEDIAAACGACLESPAAADRAFEIGGPDVLSMNEILGVMSSVMGIHKPLVHLPAIAPRTVGALMEMLPIRRRPLSRDAVTFITTDAIADNTALLAALPDLRLTPLADGLITYLAPE